MKAAKRLVNSRENIYSNSKRGKYNIGDKEIYFRSSWEANYALYLNWLISIKDIKNWEYEPKTFWFEKVRRGCRSYLPDFRVITKNGEEEYHEVKGYFDDKSKTKLKRMKKYYPEVKIVLIDSDVYKDIKAKVGAMLKFY